MRKRQLSRWHINSRVYVSLSYFNRLIGQNYFDYLILICIKERCHFVWFGFIPLADFNSKNGWILFTCKYIIDTNELANYLKRCRENAMLYVRWDYLFTFFFILIFIRIFMYAIFADLNYKLDSPWKLISLLGWMIWPRNGKNTNGIFSDDDPLTNGASVHSVNKQTNKILREKNTERIQMEEKQKWFFLLLNIYIGHTNAC